MEISSQQWHFIKICPAWIEKCTQHVDSIIIKCAHSSLAIWWQPRYYVLYDIIQWIGSVGRAPVVEKSGSMLCMQLI